MKPLSSALITLTLIVACDAATAPVSFKSSVDDSVVPEPLRAAYREDATRLALRDLLAGGYTDVAIPADALQPYYDALVLVYNATGLTGRDAVVEQYHIHTFPSPATRSLLLWLLGSETWVQRLANRQLPTGEPTVDDLMQRYSLSIGNVYTLHEGDVLVTLEPPEPLNIEALAPLFRGVVAVRSAGANGVIGDGNDIRGAVEESRVLLDYSLGYGDCPAGCINRTYYHFAVHSDATVEYLGTSGDPPPR